MSIYPEIPSAKYKEIDGVKYFVRKFGLNNQVLEEELVPMPVNKVIRTMKADGTEDTTKRITEKLVKEKVI